MGQLDVDASNACVPPSYPLSASTPPLPSTVRGEPAVFDGKCGRINGDRPVLLYSNGRLVVVRELDGDLNGVGGGGGGDDDDGPAGKTARWKGGLERPAAVRAFVYRGHTARVTAARFSPSGCYVASADVRGKLRVWSYDNEEHLCKLDLSTAMAGPIRDIAWDAESKRLCIAGEGSKTDSSSECARVIQWDTGVTCGELGQHTRGRAVSCDFKPNRPMRIVTGGGDDSRVSFNKGPPFVRVVDGTVAERCHERGAVNCVRYSPDGTRVASVGTDRSVVFYDGKTMGLSRRMEDVHSNSIYMCAWSSDGTTLLTGSADGTVKLIDAVKYEVLHEWDVPAVRARLAGGGPAGGGGATQTTEEGGKLPMGRMQMGCAFVTGDVPVTMGLNGEIVALPVPPGVLAGANGGGGGVESAKLLTGHQSAISALALDPEGGRMYTGDTDGVVCAWDVSSGSCDALGRAERVGGEEPADETLMNRVHNGAITAMVHMGGTLLSTGWDDSMRSGDGSSMGGSVKLEAQPNAMAKGKELGVVVTVGGLLLVKGDSVVSELISIPYSALSVCVSSDDRTVFVGGEDCNIHVYTVDSSAMTLNEINVIEGGHLKPIHALAISNDSSLLASADVRDICVWNAKDGFSPIIGKSRWCFHTQPISCLAWSPDDTVLASGGNDDSIYLWSLTKKMKRVHYSFAHRGGVSGLEFLPQSGAGMTLVSVGADGCANLWDVTDDVAKKFG